MGFKHVTLGDLSPDGVLGVWRKCWSGEAWQAAQASIVQVPFGKELKGCVPAMVKYMES